jgi:hypothetical protein
VEQGALRAKYHYAATAGELIDFVETQWGGQTALRDQHSYDSLRRQTGKSLQTAAGAAILPTGYDYNAANPREKASIGGHEWIYTYDPTTDEVR